MSPTIRSSRAFTLIELLVVISIIGLLSSVVLAGVNGARAKGSLAAGQNFDGHTYAAFYDDLVLSWDFDNDSGNVVQDQSGNGNNLGYMNAAGPSTQQNPFKSGKSFSMSGGVAKTGVPSPLPNPTIINSANIKNPPTGNFSVSFWLYPTIAQPTDYVFSLNGLANGGWSFSYADSATGFVFNYISTGLKTATVGQLPLNTWHHIVTICNSGKIGVYVNGKQTGTLVAVPSCGLIATQPVSFDSTQAYYLDNVRIYKQALPL